MTVQCIEIELTWRELKHAGDSALERTLRNLSKGTVPKWGQARSTFHLDDEWMGAIGEMAVSKCLNRYWAGMSYGTVDASVADVRAIGEEGHRMILHPDDRDDVPVVLALVSPVLLPKVRLLGWIIGRDGKRDEYWQDPKGGRPAFFVPNPLLPMSELPR